MGIVFLNSKMYGQKLSKKINRKDSNKNFTAKRVLLVPISILILNHYVTNVNSLESSKQTKMFNLNALYFM